MKKLSLLTAFMMIGAISFAQAGTSEGLKKHYLALYEQALKYNDLGLAILALNNVVVESQGAEAMAYKDTLSMFYFSNKSYLPSLLLADEVYKADPKNINALARTGDCYQEGADFKNAAAAFEIAAPALKSPYYYYQLAVCQYSLKKTTECMANADKVLADSNSNRIGVVFTSPSGNEQRVPVSAAALNLKGVVMMDAKNYAQAKQYLQDALKLFPGFEGAKMNVENCEKKSTSNKPVAKPGPAIKTKG